MTSAGIVLDATDRPSLRPRIGGGAWGAGILLLIVVPCFVTLPWSIDRYDQQRMGDVGVDARRAPSLAEPFGSDNLGRSMLMRCLLGGAISLGIGIVAALISVIIGVLWGAAAGYFGGRADAMMMRIVDVLYGLPYILLVVLLSMAIGAMPGRLMRSDVQSLVALGRWLGEHPMLLNLAALFLAIGGVSWLTLARVIRGQVLSLREQPFIEAARACGAGGGRIFARHLLPNLIGPIVVYTTLTVPTAVLQESFLSFLGIGVQAPLPSWGNLAATGVEELSIMVLRDAPVRWWLPLWPCLLLGLTLLALNFLGDALRHRLDPRRVR
jgi:oligopeptide transport system permease protein